MPRTSKGGNWTISLQSVTPDALWEASDIVADIQDAYDLARGLISRSPPLLPAQIHRRGRRGGTVKP